MKYSAVWGGILSLFCILFAINSCSKDDDDDGNGEPQEFVATEADFAGFMTWSLDASSQGPDPTLGDAHGGNDSTVTRNVYYKDGQDRVNGEFPRGTLIVKHSSNPDETVNEFTAMVKRGGNFNSNHNGWEWFVLESDGSIALDEDDEPMRGANLMDGACGGCHAFVASDDFVFSK